MPNSSLTELAGVLATTPSAEALLRTLDLVGPQVCADHCFFYVCDLAQGCGYIAFA